MPQLVWHLPDFSMKIFSDTKAVKASKRITAYTNIAALFSFVEQTLTSVHLFIGCSVSQKHENVWGRSA